MIFTSLSKDIVLLFLQSMFSQEDLYDGGNDYLWSSDPQVSKILISDNYTEDLENNEMRPALFLRRGPISWMKSNVDQFLHQNFRTGAKTFQDMLVSNITVSCLSRNGLEAEFLADVVFQGIQYFSIIAKKLGGFDVESSSIGEESLIQSDSQQDLTAVPVGIVLLLSHRWTVNIEGHLLEKMQIQFNELINNGKIQNLEVSRE